MEKFGRILEVTGLVKFKIKSKIAFRKFYFRPLYAIKTAVRDIRPAQVFRMLNFFDWMDSASKRKDKP